MPRERAAVRVLTVTSPVFEDGGRIPIEHARERSNLSPALHWRGLPEGTKSFAVLCEDPDAPTPEPFVHWLIYNIPPHASAGRPPVPGLPDGISRAAQPHEVPGAWQGVNDFGEVGYGGPEPPPGDPVHHYHFKLYALDRLIPPSETMNRPEFLAAIDGHVLGTGELTGTYVR